MSTNCSEPGVCAQLRGRENAIRYVLYGINGCNDCDDDHGLTLAEHYDDYCKRAQMMTEIHASKQSKDCFDTDTNACCSKSDSVRRLGDNGSDATSSGPILKRHANDKSVTKPIATTLTQKKSNIKDKKRTLKRL